MLQKTESCEWQTSVRLELVCCPFMSNIADFIDLRHGEQYNYARFDTRDCYFKLLFRYEE